MPKTLVCTTYTGAQVGKHEAIVLSPIQRLPFDVLEHIFLRCLSDPLDQVQPKINAPPMLLCHVCSSWRTIALEIPALWTHIHHRLPMERLGGRLQLWNKMVFHRKLTFLKWWRRNQGKRATFIRLRIYRKTGDTSLRRFDVDKDAENFFDEFMSSAQYLDVGPFMFDQRLRPIESSYPQLLSLVSSHPNYNLDEDTYVRRRDREAQDLFPTIPRTLQRLRLHHVSFPEHYSSAGRFKSWCNLTHLSLNYTFLDQKSWLSIARAVPNLQWCYLDVIIRAGSELVQGAAKIQLPFLSTFTAVVDYSEYRDTNHPSLWLLLQGLDLPVLRDLAIYTDGNPSDYPLITMSIEDGLIETPTITTLTIGLQFQGFFCDSEESAAPQDWSLMTPLSTYAPHIAHLVLDLCYVDRCGRYDEPLLEEKLRHWRNLLRRSKGWMDIGEPSSAIRKITTVVKSLAIDKPLVEAAFQDALDLDKQEASREIVFEVVEADKWRVAPYAEGWKTWSSVV
ncbi:hypothetical protein BDN70DRAFT_871128 [Pholiota conissans]|uniref:F-box domain-containing protein n=1 Tax=Pholiota conissans TaxID=109636 RepID=A0A9P5ZEF5_9AGAR|nr:hypothetical protein BDN70DRAFT_871128 [Pholiota conissans]